MENSGLQARLYVDGACSTNPGPMSIGVSMCNDQDLEFEAISRLLPDPGTNVIAEYEALLAGLELAIERGFQHVEAFTDSELMVKHITGDNVCNVPHLKVRLDRVRALGRRLTSFTVRYKRSPKGHKGKDIGRAHELAAAAFDTSEGKAAKKRRREEVTFRPDGNGGNAACPVS